MPMPALASWPLVSMSYTYMFLDKHVLPPLDTLPAVLSPCINRICTPISLQFLAWSSANTDLSVRSVPTQRHQGIQIYEAAGDISYSSHYTIAIPRLSTWPRIVLPLLLQAHGHLRASRVQANCTFSCLSTLLSVLSYRKPG